MGSRPTTRDEDARLPEVSRRALIAGTPAAALASRKSAFARAIAATAPVGAVEAADDGDRRLKQWLALDRKVERYQDRWAQLEGYLVREHAWFRLSPDDRRAHPGGRELRDIDGAIDVLREKRDALLEALPDARVVSMESIVTRLAVVERLVWPEDHPEAHALIAGARQDLIALAGASAVSPDSARG